MPQPPDQPAQDLTATNFEELAVNLARAILSAVGAPESMPGSAALKTPVLAAEPGTTGSAALHQEFKVVIDGIKLPADVAAGINQAIRKAVLQEIAGIDTQGDFSVSRPLAQALSAEGGGGGDGGGVAVRFTRAAMR